MGTKLYSKGNKVTLSEHFKSTEFDCKGSGCCSSTKINDNLVSVLEKIRVHFGKPLTINCGYRCVVHNAAVGGASSSKHLSGYAADIKITGVDPLKIALYADSVLGNSGGVELGSYDSGTTGYVHIDVRDAKWRAIRPKSSSTSYTSYSDMPPTVKSNASGAAVTVLSRKLRKLGYLKADSSTCNATVVAGIKAFQKANGLTADGVAGTKTWQKIADKL